MNAFGNCYVRSPANVLVKLKRCMLSRMLSLFPEEMSMYRDIPLGLSLSRISLVLELMKVFFFPNNNNNINNILIRLIIH